VPDTQQKYPPNWAAQQYAYTNFPPEQCMTSNDDLINRLGAPFSYNDIEWRVQQTNEENTKGRAVPYLRFQAIAARLDEVVGALNWKNEYVPGPCGGVVCRLSLREQGGEWVSKENGAENTSFEPVKGGLTDAFKRASVMWNIGRYLYNFPGCTVDISPDTRHIVSMPRLPAQMLVEAERAEYSFEAATGDQSGATPPAEAQAEPTVAPEAPVDSGAREQDEAAPSTSGSGTAESSVSAEDAVQPAASAPVAERTEPSEKDGLTLEDAMDSVPEGLEQAHIDRIRTILTRSWDKADIRPNMRTYVNDRTKSKMPEQAIFYVLQILERLDELDGVAAPV
jgi:hypothetical protein